MLEHCFTMLSRVTPSTLRALTKANTLSKTKILTLSSPWSQQQCALISTSVFVCSARPRRLIPGREEFASRHIGPRQAERDHMLAYLGFKVHYAIRKDKSRMLATFVLNHNTELLQSFGLLTHTSNTGPEHNVLPCPLIYQNINGSTYFQSQSDSSSYFS